ncbi:MAG: glycosyltransferase family 4 protein [Bacteroidota bacterium]
MKKLLFLTTQLPYPPVRGGVIVSWHLLSRLVEHYEVSVICILKGDDQKNEADFLQKLPLASYHGEALDIGRSPSTILKSYLKGVPINLVRNYSRVLEEKIHQAIPEHDYVLADHYEMFQYIPQDTASTKVVLHEHNAEFVMWERYSQLSRHPLRKLMTYLEARRVKAQEKAFCEAADLVLAYPNDKHILESITNKAVRFQEITPCGEEHLQDAPTLIWEETDPALLFIGSLGWEANRDGLIWFLEQGWERLKARIPDLQFYIIGPDADDHLHGLAERLDGVILTGFVDDLDEYYRRCRVFVSPLRFGSGIKIKIINAAHRGMPTVTTSIGVEGMPFVNGEDIFYSDTLNELLEQCVQLLQDQAKWQEMRDQIRNFAQQHFSWAEMVRRIRTQLSALDKEF